MSKALGIFLCLLIVVMDITAGILGIEAEMAQNKVKHLRLWIFECREPSHKAFQLGLAAAVLLGLAHVLVHLIGGINCLSSQQEQNKASPNRQLSMACLILTWIVLAVGLSMLVVGTHSNDTSRGSCGFTHHHLLSIGGIMCFVHGLFCVAYYLFATLFIN
ncbi:hypothetical protein RIF29_27352 [Crotalaria pallida]|uniref:Uncharacterized protein n=1 Tax=Crotalaria pallida TaxID=3830 RepID=A0AAN9EPV8_CROPI